MTQEYTMIPKNKFPIITSWMKTNSELFDYSVALGIGNGEDGCSSLLHAADKLTNIKFYENFSYVTPEMQQQFKTLYTNWQYAIPNLEINYKDAQTYSDVPSFMLVATGATTSRPYWTYPEYANTIFAIEGFGKALASTVYFSVLIENKQIFPIYLHTHYLFFATSINIYNTALDGIKNTFKLHNIPSFIMQYGCIREASKYHLSCTKGAYDII